MKIILGRYKRLGMKAFTWLDAEFLMHIIHNRLSHCLSLSLFLHVSCIAHLRADFVYNMFICTSFNDSSRRRICTVAWLRLFVAGLSPQRKTSPCGICGWQSGTATILSPSTTASPSQYQSTIAQYSFICLYGI